MRKIIFIGRSEAGKTTLTQAMKGRRLSTIKHNILIIMMSLLIRQVNMQRQKELAGSLAVYSAEADVVGLLISATEPFFPVSA